MSKSVIFDASDLVGSEVESYADGTFGFVIDVTSSLMSEAHTNPLVKFSRDYANYDDADYVSELAQLEELDAIVDTQSAIPGTVTLEEYRAGRRVPFLPGASDRNSYRTRNVVATTENGTPVTVFTAKDGVAYVRLGTNRSVTVSTYGPSHLLTCRCGEWTTRVHRTVTQESMLTVGKLVALHLARHAHADGL